MRTCKQTLKDRNDTEKEPDGLLLTLLQVMLSPHAATGLERICKATGKTKLQVVEQAINELERRVTE